MMDRRTGNYILVCGFVSCIFRVSCISVVDDSVFSFGCLDHCSSNGIVHRLRKSPNAEMSIDSGQLSSSFVISLGRYDYYLAIYITAVVSNRSIGSEIFLYDAISD